MVSDLDFGKKCLVVLGQLSVAPRQTINLHLHLVKLSLIATLQAARLVTQSSLKLRHVRSQLIDSSLAALAACQVIKSVYSMLPSQYRHAKLTTCNF